MAEVTAASVKELREKTGAGMMDCKKALGESGGELEKAIDWLRQKGLSNAAKKSGRAASEGTVISYIHGGGKIGVLLEVNCETDFVGKSPGFQELARDLAMHIAALSPRWVRREEVPAAELDREREVVKAQLKEQNKPEKIWDKIIEGKIERFYKDNCLVDQGYVKDPDKSVDTIVKEAVSKIGENVQVRRFARFVLGEGLAKKEDNFAEEVAKAAGLAK